MNFAERLKRDLVGNPRARFVYLNNFEVERQWAAGEPKLPGAGISFAGPVVNRMEEMGVMLAEAGDTVVLKAPVDRAYAAYLAALGIGAGHILWAENSDPERTVTQDALASPRLIHDLRALADGDTYLMPLGVSTVEEHLAKETGLPLATTTAQVCKAVNGKIFSRRLVAALGLTAVPGQICETVGELPDALRGRFADGGRAVVKESLGVSGRGNVLLDDERAASRMLRLIGRRGPDGRADLVVETWIEQALDLNYQFVVSRAGAVRFETVKALVTRRGVHQGHRFPIELPPDAMAELQHAAQAIGSALFAEGYYGVVGVDALLGPDGTVYPCLEINARFNMSTYQSRIAERIIPDGGHAVAATFGLRPRRAHTFEEVADALGDLLFDGSGRPGVLVTAFATLNAGARSDGGFHGRVYGICIADHAERAAALHQDAEDRLQRMARG